MISLKWFRVSNDIFHYLFRWTVYTSVYADQTFAIRAFVCQNKSKLEYLLQVLSESHTVLVTQSPWAPVFPLHCPRSGVPVRTDILIITNIICPSGNVLQELFCVVALRGVVMAMV